MTLFVLRKSNFSWPVTCVFLSVIQKYTAIYYVIADLAMLALYFYYKIRNKVVESECFFSVVVFYCFILHI